jgi:hypothetical protein
MALPVQAEQDGPQRASALAPMSRQQVQVKVLQ